MNDAGLPVYEFGDYRINPGNLLLTRGGQPIALTPKVFDTLLLLVKRSGEVLEKEEFLRAIWPDTIVEENNLNQNISIVRRALGETAGEHRFVVTVPGRGFRFVPEVKRLDALAVPALDFRGVPNAVAESPAPSDPSATQPTAVNDTPESKTPPTPVA